MFQPAAVTTRIQISGLKWMGGWIDVLIISVSAYHAPPVIFHCEEVWKNASPRITLKRAVPQDVGLNYKGCPFKQDSHKEGLY